ncbi:hypothetical protein [Solirubrobacter soli]|uniref:hypothetical protein n=1 Tax=Solirubrobacter soli TaxID=363832 RepID=UPI0004098706|nr:hypothetical protein [Solirubrobacter soli]
MTVATGPAEDHEMTVRAITSVAAAGCLAAGLASSSAQDRPAPADTSCAAAYTSVARRIYEQAVDGPNLRASVRRIERSKAVASAVAAGDPAATRAALRPLLRADIVRIAIMRHGRVLADAGHAAALAPATGTIDDAGVPVGTFRLSVLDDAALARIIHGLTGARVVVRAGVTSRGISGTAYPSGPLSISLSTRDRCDSTASAIARVGKRLYRQERGSAQTAHVLAVVAHDPRFARAVATDDPVALRTQIIRFFRVPSLHVVRIRATTASGALVGDVGGPYVLAPASAPVRLHGATVGTVTLSIQDDAGYIKLIRRFTGARAILTTPAGQVPGSASAPGRADAVASFDATAFPADPLRISLLIRRPY